LALFLFLSLEVDWTDIYILQNLAATVVENLAATVADFFFAATVLFWESNGFIEFY
jgi:hypothetical protein